MMKVVVDIREQAFIEILEQKKELHSNIHFEYASLPIGDMIIYYDNSILYVWERKTLSDLLASIKDGRYKEQSHRLSHTCGGSSKVVYLIEGIMSQLSFADRKVVVGATCSLMFRKQFHIWRSTHTHDSVDTFLLICQKLLRDIRYIPKPIPVLSDNNDISNNEVVSREHDISHSDCPPQPPPSYSEFVKKVKKENITPTNIGEIFLCQIPDISVASAKALMQCADGNFSQLINLVNNSPETLSNVKIECGTKTRKLSKKIVERLQQFLGNGSLC